MRVPARRHPHMEVQRRLVREGEEEVVYQLDVEAADLRLLDPDVVDEEGPAGEIDHGRHQRFVERDRRLAEAPDAGLVAEPLAEALPEAETDVLDRVMIIHL